MAQKQVKKIPTTYTIAEDLGLPVYKPSMFKEHVKLCLRVNKPVLVKGRPGVGKTEIIGQIADEEKLELIVERLNGKDPTDMGLPFVYTDDMGIKRHDWTLPSYIATVDTPLPEGKKGWLVFLDEFSQALPAMQNRIGEWINERQNNRTKIHPAVKFVLASNFAQDKAATYPEPKQVLNRCSVVVLAPDLDDTLDFISTHNIRPEIGAFAKWHRDCLDSYDPDAMINCTPRSLCSLSPLMDQNPPYEVELSLYSSCIGKGMAAEFTGFLRTYRDLPRLEDIIARPEKIEMPDEDRTDILIAMAAMIGRAMNAKNAAPLIKFLRRLPAEFSVFAIRDAIKRDPSLKEKAALSDWCRSDQAAALF